MKPDYNICDRCQKNHTPQTPRLALDVGTQQGANGTEADTRVFDLCHMCAIDILMQLAHRRNDYVDSKDVAEAIQKKLGKLPSLWRDVV